MRVLGVVRLSRRADESTSPERQRAQIEGWASIHDHDVTGWSEDLDVSGAVDPFDRPELGEWLRHRVSDFDGVVFSKVDRLTRSLKHFVDFISWADEQGKFVAAVTDNLDTSTSTGRFQANILATFAQFERERIQERNLESQDSVRRAGRWHGGTPPYGYRPVRDDSGGWVLAVDPQSSVYLQEVVERVLRGDSMNSICIDFNTRKIPTPSDHYRLSVGKPIKNYRWKTTALIPMLRSQTLMGIATTTGAPVLGSDGMPVRRAAPLVTRDEWSRVQLALDTLSRKKTRTARTAPLLGVAFCGACGEILYRAYAGNKKGTATYTYYRCRGRTQRRNGCQATSISAELLEGVTESLLLGIVGNLEVIETVTLPAESHRAELADAEASLGDLILRAAGKPPAVRRIYQSQIDSLEIRVTRLAGLPESPARTEMRPTGRTYRQQWERADSDDSRRRLLLDSGVRIYAHADPTADPGAVRVIPAVGSQLGATEVAGGVAAAQTEDAAILLHRRGGIHLLLTLPEDVAERVTGDSASRLQWVERQLLGRQ